MIDNICDALDACVPSIRRRWLADRCYTYEVHLEGALDPKWSTWFEGLTMKVEGGETVLVGEVPDQPALYGLIERIRDLGLPLVSVKRI